MCVCGPVRGIQSEILVECRYDTAICRRIGGVYKLSRIKTKENEAIEKIVKRNVQRLKKVVNNEAE